MHMKRKRDSMSDLISRESAMELIEIVFEDAIYGGEFIDAYEPVKTAIMAVSAEELPEPKRGRWENREGYDNWNCSECDHEIVGYDENPVEYGVNYCEKCGAYMVSEQPEEATWKNSFLMQRFMKQE